MSAYDLKTCLAGLDNIPPALHDIRASDSTTNIVNGNLPHINVYDSAEKKVSIGRDRPPLTDKSRDSNLPTTKHIPPNEAPFQYDHLAVMDSSDFKVMASGLNIESTSTTPLSFTARVQLPSFLKISFHTMATLPELAPTCFPLLPPICAFQPTTTECYDEGSLAHPTVPTAIETLIAVPSATHPNSPYVPWAPHVGQGILQASTALSRMSDASCRYSHPRSPTGAQVPESMEFRQGLSPSGGKFSRLSKSIIRDLKLAIKVKVGHAVKCILRLKEARRSHTNTHQYKNSQPRSVDRIFALAESLNSSETNTLVTWLQDRQRASQEHGRDVSHYTSLDEYERVGSWLDLSHERCGNVTKDSPCRMSQILTTALIDTSLTYQSFSMSWLQEGESRSCPSTPIQIQPRTYLSGVDSDLLRSLDLARGGSEQSQIPAHDLGSVRGRMKELKMPGGWIFNC